MSQKYERIVLMIFKEAKLSGFGLEYVGVILENDDLMHTTIEY